MAFSIEGSSNNGSRRKGSGSIPISESRDTAASTSTWNEERRTSFQRRFSCYDNLEQGWADKATEEETDEDEDRISPPWDATKYEHLIKAIAESVQEFDHGSRSSKSNTRASHSYDVGGRLSAFKATPVINTEDTIKKAEEHVADVVRRLAEKDNGLFGPVLKSFISCTIAVKNTDPRKIMRNVRQFISGMKNYLLIGVNAESEELRKEIKKQNEALRVPGLLYIDGILEDVLTKLVIVPLKPHIRGLDDEELFSPPSTFPNTRQIAGKRVNVEDMSIFSLT